MIRFTDKTGKPAHLMTFMRDDATTFIIEEPSTPDDVARAFHDMTDAEVLAMGRAYGRLPRLGGMRSFDEAFVKALEQAEARLAEVTRERDEARSQLAESEAARKTAETRQRMLEAGNAEWHKLLETTEQDLRTLREAATNYLEHRGGEYSGDAREALEKAIATASELPP